MRSAASSTSFSSTPLARHGWWLVWLAALVWLGVATRRRIDRVDALTNSPTWSVDSPRRESASPTGFEQGQRTLIVPGQHTPSFTWIMEAQSAASEGRWRLRHIGYDAPPNGRDTLRTAPYRWWLIAVGWLRATAVGEPLGYAIERGTLVADPLLLALLIVAGGIYVARYFGPAAAIGFAMGGASLFPFAANFQPGAPDPHSLAWVLALGSVLPLLVPCDDDRIQRRHFILAGLFGGVGFWNDAKSQAPVLVAVLLGGIAYELIRPRDAADSSTKGETGWRAWAGAGAITILAASGFEFAPNHFSWSLDAVSPIHAAVWWGMGEVLTAVGRWRRGGWKAFDRRAQVYLAGAGLAIAAWPVVGWVTHSGTLPASDFYALELANRPNGTMSPTLGAWLHREGDDGAKWATLLPALLVVVAAARLALGRIARLERARLALVAVTAVVAVILAFLQLRWWNLFDVLALAMLATLLATSATGAPRWGLLGALLLVVPGAIVGFPAAITGHEVNDITPQDAQALVTRDFSYWLAKRHGADHDVVYSTPIFSSATAYYGGFDVIVSGDGENKTGYLAAARIANASTLDEASILIQSRGITRVALPLWDPMLGHLVRTVRNLSDDQPLPDDAFVAALMRWESPVWLRPMNYVVPATTGLQDFQVVTYAVQAPMDSDLFLSRLADFFVERGLLPAAQSVSDSLKDYPRSIVALGATANVALARQDEASATATVDKLIPYLSRVTARHLPADRRISLAGLLLRTRHADLAREQLTSSLKELDAASLRTLTPGMVTDLLGLSRALSVPVPTEIKAAALGLIPPAMRSRLAH